MSPKETVMESLQYVERHLTEPLKVQMIAKQAGYSEFHFSRMFKEYMGISVMEYVKKRRLHRAAEEITKGRRIIDAALDYGYQSHGGFTKAFRQEFGFSPALLHTMLVEMRTLGGITMVEKMEYVKKEVLFECLKEEICCQQIQMDEEMLQRVYDFSCEIFGGMLRYSGEEYVTHPLNVALILAKMGAGESVILAGLITDEWVELGISKEELYRRLPREAADILVQLGNTSPSDWKLPEDEDIVMVALADRIHNMCTVEYLKKERQVEKAKETLELFLPIANRLGNERLAAELSNLSMKCLKGFH